METTNYPNIQDSSGGSLRDFLAILFKRKAAILTIFLATVITVAVGSFLMSPTYEARSSLLVKFGREFIYRSEVGDKAPMISFNQEEAINSEINILTSRDIIERVIKTIKLENIYPELAKNPPARMTPMEAAVIVFQKKLTAEGIKKSSVIEVSFQHKDPQVAARAVNLRGGLLQGEAPGGPQRDGIDFPGKSDRPVRPRSSRTRRIAWRPSGRRTGSFPWTSSGACS